MTPLWLEVYRPISDVRTEVLGDANLVGFMPDWAIRYLPGWLFVLVRLRDTVIGIRRE